MAAVPIVECKGGKCEIIGEIDIPDGSRDATARSSDGDFRVRVTPIYVGKQANGRAVVFGIASAGKTRTDWAKVQSFRAAPVKGVR